MKQAYNYKSLQFLIKDMDKETGIVKGYFPAFNIPDSDRDVIRPGAFQKSINENGPNSTKPRIKHLLNHDVSKPLGKLTDLKEDAYGLAYESKVGSHSLGVDFLKMVDDGLITEHSIGFQTTKQNQIGDWKNNDNSPVWEITEAKLWEGSSLTGWGANQYTPLVKSTDGKELDILSSHIDRIEKFCRKTDATDDTIEMLLIQVKQMQQLIIDIKQNTTLAVENTPLPDSSKTIDWKQLLTNIKN